MKTVQCEACNIRYSYELRRQAVGRSSHFMVTPDIPKEAMQQASDRLRKLLERACDPVPCPACGWYQRDMVKKARQLRYRPLVIAGVVLFIIAGFLSLPVLIVAISDVPRVLEVRSSVGYFVLLVLWGGSLGAAALCLGLRVFLAFFFDPNRADVESRIELGRSRALPPLEQAEKHLPDAMSWFQVAVAREGVGDLPGAIAAYERALALDPNYALAWFNLGGIYWNLRDFSQARETWSEAIARFPEHKEARKLQRDLPFLFDGRKVEMVEEIQPCSPSELEAQIAYLASTPVAGIAQYATTGGHMESMLLESGHCRLSKGVVRSLAVLGSLKTEFGQLGTLTPPSTSGEQKFRVAQVLPALRQLPDGGDLLRRIERFLQMNEADIEYNVTVMRIGSDLIVKDGNARTIAFYERRKDFAEPFAYRVFLVEWTSP